MMDVERQVLEERGIPDHWDGEALDAALLVAVRQGRHETATALLARGARPVSQAGAGGSRTCAALAAAIDGGDADMVQLLLRGGAEAEPELPRALHSRHRDIQFAVLGACRDVNLADGNGDTVLHLAAKRCDLEIIQELVRRGASVHARSAEGRTALHYAVEHRRSAAVLRYLIACGADVHARDTVGCTALWQANGDALTVLIASGAAADDKNDFGVTPLMSAVARPAAAAALLAAGANPLATDIYGNTALHAAAFSGLRPVVAALMARGLSPAALNGDGKSALDIAGERLEGVLADPVLRNSQVASRAWAVLDELRKAT